MAKDSSVKRRHKYGAIAVKVCRTCEVWHEEGSSLAWRGYCIHCGHKEAIRFPSKLEARRFAVLSGEQRSGKISGLELQPKFPIEIGGVKICKYVADFAYLRDGKRVVEDAKGTPTPVFKLKLKLVAAIYGIEVEIVR